MELTYKTIMEWEGCSLDKAKKLRAAIKEEFRIVTLKTYALYYDMTIPEAIECISGLKQLRSA